MSKKINFGTIKEESIEMLSQFHCAIFELRSWSDWRKAELEKVDEEIAATLEKRKKAIAEGMTENEAISAYSVDSLYKEKTRIEKEYDTETKKHKTAMKEAQKMVDDNIYHAYVLCWRKGDLNAKGVYTVKKGKKTVDVSVDKSFKEYVKEFCTEIGCANTENETAMDKFADVMRVRCSGGRIMSKGENYVAERSESQFKKFFMYNFLQYTIVDKGVITVNDDNTLSMTVYENEDTAENTAE